MNRGVFSALAGAARHDRSSDERLVKDCLAGSEDAWAALIDRYKNLIFSIPVKQGFSQEDAADIFQAVCAELIAELGNLREPKALPAWLIQVTVHKCSHLRKQQQRFVADDGEAVKVAASPTARPDSILRQLEKEQSMREAVRGLTPRCQELVRALFFEDPPRPYEQVAASLGLAQGSIGFIRGRCLDKLRARLEEMDSE